MTQLELTQEEKSRYARHIILPDIGMEGQLKLKDARVLIVGLGGLGSPVAMYLAAAGVGTLGLVDPDRVDLSNLQRQIIHSTSQQGNLKVNSAKTRLLDLNPNITVNAYPNTFSSQNAHQIAESYDIIVDGTDNIPTRYLLNDLAVISRKPYVYGSIYRFEGQVSVFATENGPCYRCLFPEPPPPGTIPPCSIAGVMGVLPGIIGSLQAAEVIKLITGIGNPLIGRLLLFDALDMSMDTVKIRRRDTCKVCGTSPDVTELIDYEAWCGVPAVIDSDEPLSAGDGLDIDPVDVKPFIEKNANVTFLDIREEAEYEIADLPNTLRIPMDMVERRLNEIPQDQPVIVFCRNGDRSIGVVYQLEGLGFSNVKNLRGGTNAWSNQVDPTIARY